MDYHKKEVVFRKLGDLEVVFRGDRKQLPIGIISSIKAGRLLSKGCSSYLAFVIYLQAFKTKPEDVAMVREFLDVFLEELISLPHNREVEFTIDLIQGTTPISQAPYRMTPKELK